MAPDARLGGLSLVLGLVATSCSEFQYLKSASVPVARGHAELVRGAGYDSAPASPVDPAGDWPYYNRSLDGQRYSPLDDITVQNIDRLVEVCDFPIGEQTDFQGGPIAVGGTVYLTTAKFSYAIDPVGCRLRWRYQYDYHPGPAFDLAVNRGAAYAGGTLYRGANDGRVYALDAATGRELWNVVVANPRHGETVPAAPVVWRGLVLVGNAGGDNFAVIGRMNALLAADGGRRWSTPLVPESGPAAATWPAHTEVLPKGGGATWTSYAIDTLTGDVIVGTGNAAPDFLGEARPGANLHTTSVVAIDTRDGTIRWATQLVERDIHDWDVSAAPLLVRTRKGAELVVAAGKDGYLHALNRIDGKPVFRAEVSTHDNVARPLGPTPTRFCPGVNGGVEWNGPAFSREENLLVVGSIDWCTTVTIDPVARLAGRTGLPWTGSAQLRHPFGVPDSVRSGWLTAIDADRGDVRWRYRSPTPLVAGVTATAGGLIFTGDLLGRALAFDAATGQLLWQASIGLPIGGGVITFRAGGRQYLAVAAGFDAPDTWQISSPPAHLVVYALPAGAKVN